MGIKQKKTEQQLQEKQALASRVMYEGSLVLAVGGAIFLWLALGSYTVTDPGWLSTGTESAVTNRCGYFGAWLADLLLCLCGFMAYIVPILLIYGVRAWAARFRLPPEIRQLFWLRVIGGMITLFAGCALLTLYVTGALPCGAGGIFGTIIQEQLINLISVSGARLLLFILLFFGLTWFLRFSWYQLIERLGGAVILIGEKLKQRLILPRKVIAEKELVINQPAKKMELVRSTTEKSSAKIVEKKEEGAPLITPVTVRKKPQASETLTVTTVAHAEDYAAPDLNLLDLPTEQQTNDYSQETLEAMSRNVEAKLRDFGIDVKVMAVHPGPVVTRFELQLAAGTKVSRISALARDLARSLAVISVRVVEVIPGKSYIGLELPNPQRETVRLREVLASQQYHESQAPLALALGKDIAGYPVVVDLAKMPHLLVAGTTGSGKSVCLNALLLSLLYKYSPTEVRLILIDPKMLELSVYADIPHLLTPVVTDMHEAVSAFRWCVAEMEHRYRLMTALGVRNLAGFNQKVLAAQKAGEPLKNPFYTEGQPLEPELLTALPYIVVLADEYADMMMVVGKKVEELIARIAQKARAAGIHLILATQRPSVDVITGLIKANIPTRIAFQVSSKIDSRTILDQGGAEQLLGSGDMLYLPPGSGVPVRVHGAFVADEEVHRVVTDLRSHGTAEYCSAIVANTEPCDEAGKVSSDPEQDPLYDQAVQIVLESQRTSISYLQRRLRIGYNRAASLIEAMEAAGLLSAQDGSSGREILLSREDEH